MVTRDVLFAAVLFCGVSSIAQAQEEISAQNLRLPERGSPEKAELAAPLTASPLLQGVSPKNALAAVEKLRPERRTRSAQDSAIFREAAPAVVLVVTDGGFGSGTLLKGGEILTNAHVVGSAKQVGIIFLPPDKRAPSSADVIRGDVLMIDQVKDLALVHPASVPGNAKSMEIDATDAFEVGADVHAIGHPTGEFWTYTKGIISQIRPDYVWKTEEGGIEHKATVIQTQTPINPGNSGGPLISEEHKLVGVNSFGATGLQGLNYAVAAKSVREFLAATSSVPVSGGETVAQAPQQGGSQAACEPKLLFEGRSADGKSSMRQFSLRCDDTVDLTILEPDNKKEPFLALMDTERRGKIDAIILDPRRKYHWEKSFWDVDFNDTFRLAGLHRNGEFQPYRFEKRCGGGKALTDFRCS